MSLTSRAVSYTHLDVYKRQVLGSYYLTTIIDKVYATDEIRNPGVFTSIADWEKARCV